ncbi:MAG: protein kinase domain-containing protein [Myxococcales bacterium]
MAYDLEARGLIGRGAHGLVLAAFDRAQRRFFALKVVEVAGGPGAVAALLAAERRWLSGEADPPIPRVEIFAEEGGEPGLLSALPPRTPGMGARIGILMPLVLGPTARQLAEGDPSFGRREAAALIALTAKRLAQLHERGAHLDLKPENVMVERAGRVFLIDAHGATVAGTAPFQAPEQSRPGAAPGPAADLWALGTMGLWLLAGRFPEKGLELPELSPPPSLWPPQAREAFSELVRLLKGLRRTDPAARGTAVEVAARATELAVAVAGADLAGVIAAAYARATLPEWIARVRSEVEGRGEGPSPEPAPPRAPGRRSRVGLVAALALALGGAAWLGSRRLHHSVMDDLPASPAPVPAPRSCDQFGEILDHELAYFLCTDETPREGYGVISARVEGPTPAETSLSLAGTGQRVWRAVAPPVGHSVRIALKLHRYTWRTPVVGGSFVKEYDLAPGPIGLNFVINGRAEIAPEVTSSPQFLAALWEKIQKQQPDRVVRHPYSLRRFRAPVKVLDGPVYLVKATVQGNATLVDSAQNKPCDANGYPVPGPNIGPRRPQPIPKGEAIWACPPWLGATVSVKGRLEGFRPDP